MEVCRMRNTPVICFINKLDREGRDPFELLDEIEEKLAIKVRPLSWPISMGKTFKGVYNFRPGLMTPKPHQKHVKPLFRAGLVLAPLFKLFFPALTLEQVGRAMIACVNRGAMKQVLEVPDIAELAAD